MIKALQLDLTRDRELVRLSAPIVGGMFSQTILNLVDTAMVGRLSPSALAAAGLGSTATWLSVSILLGIGTATQALVARRIGEGRDEEAGRVLDNSLLLGGIAGLIIGTIIFSMAPAIFSVLASSDEVAELGTGYLQMRTLGFPFVVMNFAFRGFYHGIGDTKTYLKAIALTNVINLVLDAVLIFGLFGFPRMGVKGVGLATAIALACGTAYYVFVAIPSTGVRSRFRAIRRGSIAGETCRRITKILVPNGLQGLGMALGFMVFYWMMAQIGTIAVAVNNVTMNVASMFYLPALGMGLASATMVGQSLGRGEPDEAEAWGWESARLAAYLVGGAGLVLTLVPELVMYVFTDEAAVVSEGRLALQALGASQVMVAITMVLSNVLVSAGCAKWVMVINVIITYLLILPLTYVFSVVMGGGVALAWCFQGLGRAVGAVGMVLKFKAGGWKENKL